MVVIGAAAGCLAALTSLVGALRSDLDAALFVARHRAPGVPSQLPAILSRSGRLAAVEAEDAATIEAGRIYVAPPDRHLLLEPGRLVVTDGPAESSFRPSIDALFRSAAHAYGPRVIGVVLSGRSDDGARGLVSVQRAGGVAIVQSPPGGPFAVMSKEAMPLVRSDHVLRAEQLGPVITRIVDGYPSVAAGRMM